MLADDNEMIDPVVVSSCIFMEDETLDMQAKGKVDKVRANDWDAHWLASG
jgi:hypothetical protein